jgi:amino acid transporter
MFTTRAMFAWSFDRIFPSRFASVSSRMNGSPVFATIVSVVLAEFMIFLFAFTSATSLYAVTTFGIMVTYMILVLSVAVFPYVRRGLFQSSDIRKSVGGTWVVTLVGLLAAIFLGFMGYYYIVYPGLGGFSSLTVETVIVLFIVSCVIYFASKAYHARRGINIGLAFQEIPPE